MKKFFSAILLMTMMVFSVGTFVSCNDLVEEVETIKGQTSDIESTIKGLETQIAALETALKAEIKSAADQAKADAIKEAKAECEVLKAAFEQALAGKADTKALEELAALVEAKIAAIEPELAKMATKVELEDAVKELVAKDTQLATQIAALEAYKATADTAFAEVEAAIKAAEEAQAELKAIVEENYTELYDLIGKNAGYIASCIEDIDLLKTGLAGYMETTDANLDEITGYLTSAIEDIDLLKGNVEKLQEDMKVVNEKVAELAEKVEKIDADLKTFNTLLNGLVSQIQSVVWVPGFNAQNALNEMVTVDKYYYGNDFTTFRFLATYEVSPKSLVSKLTNETVNVYFSNDIKTKAEPQTYAAEIVSTDPATGRVVVRGKITDKKTEVFKLLNADATSKAEAVAVALHIEEKVEGTIDETTVDAGTYVTAQYTQLNSIPTSYDIATLFRLFDTEKDNKKPQTNAYVKEIPVPYTTAPANSTRALFPIDVRMAVEGGYLTLAQATAYFGIPFNVTYGVSNDPSYSPNNNATKALFTVTNPKSTAATVALAKAATADNVFDQVSITVDKIMINNVQLPGYAFTSTYFVDYGTTTDIVLESYAVDWNYNYYYDSYYGNIYSHAASIYNYPEMDVVTSPIDITQIYVDTANGFTWPIQFAHNDIKAYGPDGKEIKNLLNSNHYIGFSALTSKVAKLQEVILPFADVPVTYKARTIVTNGYNMMKYSVAFDITLGARPADKEIDLGTFNVSGSQSHSTQIPVSPIAKAVAADAASFANLPVLNVQVPATVTPWNQWNFVESKNTNGLTLNNVFYGINYNYTAYEEKAYLEVAPSANYGASYDLKETYEFYGIKYTFKAKVNYQKPAYKLVPNPKFVKNGVVDLTGKVTYPLYAKNVYTDAVEYALDKINLREYVNVEGESVADKLNNELQIVYTVNKTIFDYTANQYVVPAGVSVANASTYTVNASNQNNNYVEVLPENILTWDDMPQYTWNQFSTINEVQVTFQLLSKDGKVKFGDAVTLKLVVPELLKFETTKTLTQPWKNNDALTVTNIYKALKITDTKNNIQVNNPNATSAADFFDYVYTANKQTVTKTGVRNVYDITVVPDASKVKIYLKSGAALTANDYIFDPATGDVQLANNTGNITDNVIIEIPVAMYHMYQGDHAHTTTVKVEFTK